MDKIVLYSINIQIMENHESMFDWRYKMLELDKLEFDEVVIEIWI